MPPEPGLAIDQEPNQEQKRHQEHLITTGIGDDDIRDQMD
jgi:hypothetical protein